MVFDEYETASETHTEQPRRHHANGAFLKSFTELRVVKLGSSALSPHYYT